jgi:uncharacterized protein
MGGVIAILSAGGRGVDYCLAGSLQTRSRRMSETGQQPSDVSARAAGMPDKSERMLGMACHLLGLLVCIPFNIVAPLVLWVIKKDEYPFVNDQGKEAVNFQITMAIAVIASVILSFLGVGVFIGLALFAVDVIFVIIATIKASNGEAYRYPVSLRLIK